MAAEFGAVFDLVTSPAGMAWRQQAGPVWLWSVSQGRMRWANAAALALWGADAFPALSRRADSLTQPGLARLTQIAAGLPRGGGRIERLRFFLGGKSMNLTCRCEAVRLGPDRLVAVSVMDRVTGLDGPGDGAENLLKGMEDPAIAASPDGAVLYTNPAAGDAAGFDGIAALVSSLAGDETVDGTLEHKDRQTQARARLVDGFMAILLDEAAAQRSAAADQPDNSAGAAAPGKDSSAGAGEPVATEVIFKPAWDSGGEDGPPAPAEPASAGNDDNDDNVLPFRGSAMPQPRGHDQDEKTGSAPLASHERDAFRNLARALGARMEGEESAVAESEAEEITAPAPDPVAARATAIPTLNAEDAGMLLSRLPLGVLIYRQAAALYANRAFLEMFGFANFTELTQAGDVSRLMPRLEAHDAALLDDGRSEQGVRPALLVARDLAGRAMRVVARLQAVRWHGEAAMLLSVRPPDGGLATVDDDEPQHPAPREEETRASRDTAGEDERETIIALATDGVAILDENGRITLLDRQAESLFAAATADIAGKPFTDLFAHDSRASIDAYLDGIKGLSVPSLVGTGRRVTALLGEKSEMPMHLVMGRLSEDAGRRYCAVLRDITQSLKTEADLTAARKKAESASKQKSEFIGRVSHELRTPLNSILGFSEVILEERFGTLGNERYLDYVRDINDSGKHLLSLVNDLLDLSRVEAGKLELNFTSVDVNEAAVESVRLMLQEAARGRVIVRSSLGRRLPQIVADHRSLRQMLLNLLSNAIKFTLPGGQVVLSTRLTEAGAVQIRVRDTGIGMEQQDIAVAMEPFRQVATAPAPHTPGAGLGLPLTKALAHANRAEFRIESNAGAGTLTEITFPPRKVLAT